MRRRLNIGGRRRIVGIWRKIAIMKISPSPTAGIILGVAGVLVLSPDALILRLIADNGVDNFTIAAGRALSLSLLAAALSLSLPVFRRGFCWRPGILYGVVYAAGLASFPMSVAHTHVANTVVILAVAPLLSAIGAWWFLRERISVQTWIAATVAAAGLVLVFAPQMIGGGGLGDALAFITALSLAGGAIIIRRYPQVNLFPGFIIGGGIVAAIYLPLGDWQLAVANYDWLMFNGAVVLLAFLFIMAASRRLPPPEINLLFLLETALAPLWVWLVLVEVPPFTTVLAGFLIVGILAWHSLLRRRAAAV